MVITTIERGYSQWWPKVFVMAPTKANPLRVWEMKAPPKIRSAKNWPMQVITLADGALAEGFQREFPIYLAMTSGIRSVDLVPCGLW